MPRQSGYRGRAVKKVRNQGNRKVHNPTVKFILNKSYEVSKSAAQVYPTYQLTINASTPFSPLHTINGDWDANDTTKEPMGLASDLYSHYQHLVVKGCHVTASVTDDPDHPLNGEDITKGTVAIVRHTGLGSITAGSFTPTALKTMYGSKQKNFQLSPRGSGAGTTTVSNNILTKNAKLSNGYSAKKTWNTNANANDDLRVANVSGSSNTPNDSTYISIGIMPQRENQSVTRFVQPTIVNVRIVYIIQFQEPTFRQSVPLPMSAAGGKKSNSQAYSDWANKVMDNPFFKRFGEQFLRQAMNYARRRGDENLLNFNAPNVD